MEIVYLDRQDVIQRSKFRKSLRRTRTISDFDQRISIVDIA